MIKNLQSADESWLRLLEAILDQGVEELPRGKRTKELIGFTSRLDMSRPIVTVAERKLGYKFLAAEAWWIASGSNRVDQIASYSKMISTFSDDGLTFRGAYGPQIADQLPWVAEQLKNDPSTRQAVLTIWRPRPGPSKDYPCTIAAQWLLRREQLSPEQMTSAQRGAPAGSVKGGLYLHCNVTMRSSDAWMGFVYDVFNFSVQSAFLIAYLRTAYPDVFQETIKLGKLTFTAGSQHLYEEHFETARDCIFDPSPKFTYAPLSPGLYQRDPWAFLDHVKSLADRDVNASPFMVNMLDASPAGTKFGAFEELYSLGGSERKTGFDAESDPRGLAQKDGVGGL